MLTGDESVSSGTALVDSLDIKTSMAQVRQRIGYAPQFDALIDLMTGRELLSMFARLRGVPEASVDEEVAGLVTTLGLGKYADKYSKTYSGGNKRKLSTGMALVGDPAIVLLDEPTSGMDPGARRLLWDVLQRTLESGKCIVLTSHSMEECESLCSNLAIMVNGKFKCIGSQQHLKNKFNRGFKLLTKVPDAGCVGALEEYLKDQLGSSVQLADQHATTLQWAVVEEMPLARIFEVLEKATAAFGLQDYSVSQTTLEQVFITFAREQHDVEQREADYRARRAPAAAV